MSWLVRYVLRFHHVSVGWVFYSMAPDPVRRVCVRSDYSSYRGLSSFAITTHSPISLNRYTTRPASTNGWRICGRSTGFPHKTGVTMLSSEQSTRFPGVSVPNRRIGIAVVTSSRGPSIRHYGTCTWWLDRIFDLAGVILLFLGLKKGNRVTLGKASRGPCTSTHMLFG